MVRFVVISALLGVAYSSYCGDSAVPFSFEALPDGQPVLGCARPTCFGWSATGQPASQNGNFYRINKKPDGFMRSDRTSIPPFANEDTRRVQQMTSACENTFQSTSCSGENQWVGGIAPLLNVSAFPTVLQCCNYEPLSLSSDRGVAVVNPGQIVVGGEVMKNGRQYAFDYIADILKTINSDGSVSYDVSVRRMPCLPLPEDNSQSGKGPANGFKAYQAPTIQSENPILIAEQQGANNVRGGDQVSGPFEAEENALVEEVVAEDGVEVPRGGQTGGQQGQVAGQQAVGQQGPAGPSGQNGVQFYEARAIYGPGQAAQAPIQQFQAPVQQPAQQQYYYPAQQPTYYYSGNSGGGYRYYCFTADTLVETIQGEMKRMDELEKGDWIQTLNGTAIHYAPITFWLHRVPSQEAEFIKFTLEDGTELKLTGQHYIYKTKCSNGLVDEDNISKEAVFAENVDTGDCLYRVTDENIVTESRVVKKETVTETGIYAPMTSNGKLVVNGVYASCHNIVQEHTISSTFFSYMQSFNDVYDTVFSRKEKNDLPYGMETLVSVLELVLPKQLSAF